MVSLDRIAPPVEVPEVELWRLVDGSFAQRRKTMRNALVRLGVEPARAEAILETSGMSPAVRPEELGLREFACVLEAMGP